MQQNVGHLIPAKSVIPGYPGSDDSENSLAAECITECEIEFLEQEGYFWKWITSSDGL